MVNRSKKPLRPLMNIPLKESPGLFKQFIESASEAFVLLDENLTCLSINQAGARLLGMPQSELIGKNILDVVPDVKKSGRYDKYMNVIKTGEPYYSDELIPSPKFGDKRLTVKAFKVGAGLGMIVDDVTERKKTEDALRHSEEFFRAVTENALDGITVLDMNGKIAYVSPSVKHILGYKQDELIGTDYFFISHPNEILQDSKLFDNLTQISTFNTRTESMVKHKNGSWRIVEAVANPVSRNGIVDGIVINWRDITERRRIEEELRSLSSYLQQAREQERALIARQIHDELGQALTAFKMDLAWLNHRLNAEQEPLLKKTRAMLELTDKAIQTVRTLSSELSPKLIEDLGLEAALDWLTEEFQNRTGIECKLTLKSKDIALEPERATAVFRIFQEALTNIARHANATKVKVSLRETDSKFVFRIVDNGKGITREQVSNPRSFGLMGMRERARFCGGEVEITGSQDKGTAVIVRIPLNKEEPR